MVTKYPTSVLLLLLLFSCCQHIKLLKHILHFVEWAARAKISCPSNKIKLKLGTDTVSERKREGKKERETERERERKNEKESKRVGE